MPSIRFRLNDLANANHEAYVRLVVPAGRTRRDSTQASLSLSIIGCLGLLYEFVSERV